jgi:hypothetical protein
MSDAAGAARKRGPRPCPICNKMSVERYHPFCSDRCANIDLHRWLGGSYRLPSREPADFGEGEILPQDDTEE